MEKWSKEVEEVEEVGDAMMVELFRESLRPGPLYENLIADPPEDYAECIERAASLADVEEAMRRKRKEENESTPSKKQNWDRPSRNQRKDQERNQRWNQKEGRDQFQGDQFHGYREQPGEKFTRLTLPVREVFQYLLDCNMVQPRDPPESKQEGADKSKFCKFHRQHCHDLHECAAVKRVIEILNQAKLLDVFVDWVTRKDTWKRNDRDKKGG